MAKTKIKEVERLGPEWFGYWWGGLGNCEVAVRLDKILTFNTDCEWLGHANFDKGAWKINVHIIFENRPEPEIISMGEPDYNKFLSALKKWGSINARDS